MLIVFTFDMSKEIKDQVEQLLDNWMEAFNNKDMHVSVVFQRYDKENKPHSKYEALYVVTKINSNWGVQVRSSLAP